MTDSPSSQLTQGLQALDESLQRLRAGRSEFEQLRQRLRTLADGASTYVSTRSAVRGRDYVIRLGLARVDAARRGRVLCLVRSTRGGSLGVRISGASEGLQSAQTVTGSFFIAKCSRWLHRPSCRPVAPTSRRT